MQKNLITPKLITATPTSPLSALSVISALSRRRLSTPSAFSLRRFSPPPLRSLFPLLMLTMALVLSSCFDKNLFSLSSEPQVNEPAPTPNTPTPPDPPKPNPPSYAQLQKLLAEDPQSQARLGWSIATSGNTVVVGAPLQVNDQGSGKGAAYVFTRTGNSWSQQAKLTAGAGVVSNNFGWSVAIAGDTIAVGALFQTGELSTNGAVYVFTRTSTLSGTTWSQQAKLTTIDLAGRDAFGYSVALGGVDGNTLAVGDNKASSTGKKRNGVVHVFTRTGGLNGTWSQQAKLTASDQTDFDLFGWAVALTASTGDTLAVGVPYAGSGGAAYVFTRTGGPSGGLNGGWSQQAKLTASDQASGDQFGYAISLAEGRLAVGAYGKKSTSGSAASGAAYVFTRTGGLNGTWNQQAKLTASDQAGGDNFGYALSLVGSTLAVGAFRENADGKIDTGSAYLFKHSSTVNTAGAGKWSETQKLVASDKASGDNFGRAVGLLGADTLLVGASGEDSGGKRENGAVYLFKKR